MGSRNAPVQPVRPFNKISSTPPAIKKQLSIPGNTGSPARRFNNNNNNANGGKYNISLNLRNAKYTIRKIASM